jgi:cell division protein FtsL
MSARAAARASAPGHAHRSRPIERERPREQPRPAHRAVPARHARRRLGLLIIPLIAVLLAGIVWVNVSTLAFTAETGRVVEQVRVLEAENVRLKAQLDRADATVVDRAAERLGMGLPADNSVTPLRVSSP